MGEVLAEDLFDQDKLEGAKTDVDGDDVALKHLCSEIYARISSFLQEDFPPDDRLRQVQTQTHKSLGIIRQALETYSLDELSLSYNGGKDCLVLLILYLCALSTRPPARPAPHRLQSVYVVPAHPFVEVDAFVTQTSAAYHLEVTRYSSPMPKAFEAYLRERPRVKAVLVGTRRTDPHGARLKHFDPTNGEWPPFMRVHPVIDWHYAEIWAFLRHLHIPYCSLYDRGYTSLGGTTDTHPNPALRIEPFEAGDGDGEERFRPAYELMDDYEERLGRDS